MLKIFQRSISSERYITPHMDTWKIFMVTTCIKNLKCLFFQYQTEEVIHIFPQPNQLNLELNFVVDKNILVTCWYITVWLAGRVIFLLPDPSYHKILYKTLLTNSCTHIVMCKIKANEGVMQYCGSKTVKKFKKHAS